MCEKVRKQWQQVSSRTVRVILHIISPIKRVRDPATCRVFGIKYSKIFRAEYFLIKSATKPCDASTLPKKYSSGCFYSSTGSKSRKYVFISTASSISIGIHCASNGHKKAILPLTPEHASSYLHQIPR